MDTKQELDEVVRDISESVVSRPLMVTLPARTNGRSSRPGATRPTVRRIDENTYLSFTTKQQKLCKASTKTFETITTDAELERFIRDTPAATPGSVLARDNSLRYYFDQLAVGIYGTVRSGEVRLVHLTNLRFRQDWRISVDVAKYRREKKKAVRYSEKFDNDKRSWTANNCLLGSTLPRYYSERRMHYLSDMLGRATKQHAIPDRDFMIGRRDFPTLGISGGFPYTDIMPTDARKYPLPMLPCYSMCGSPAHADIPIPNEDDWEQVSSMLYPPDCRSLYLESVPDTVPWDAKKSTAVWRGKATGCGVTVETNQRLHLYLISKQWETEKPGLLDAGVTGWNIREKVWRGGEVDFLRVDKLPRAIRRRSPRMSLEAQRRYKYALNLDGHVAAFRLSYLLSCKCVVLQVDSPRQYRVWYSDLLVPGVHYLSVKSDLSDLEEKISWCKAHDNECVQIVKRANDFHAKHIELRYMLSYVAEQLRSGTGPERSGLGGHSLRQLGGDSLKTNLRASRDDLSRRYADYKRRRALPTIVKSELTRAFVSFPAIIVPYRDRAEHLREISAHFKAFFGDLPYTLYVVEQSIAGRFNRGLMLNAGFAHAAKASPPHTHYIFHDVDSLPERQLLNHYTWPPPARQLLHMASPAFYRKYTFNAFLGAVVSASDGTFRSVNGFPNSAWGWGGEDDCLMNRCAARGVTIVRPSRGGYRLLDHSPPSRQQINQNKKKNILEDLDGWKSDGLNQLDSLAYRQTPTPFAAGVWVAVSDVHGHTLDSIDSNMPAE